MSATPLELDRRQLVLALTALLAACSYKLPSESLEKRLERSRFPIWIAVYLKTGIRRKGQLVGLDQNALILRHETGDEIYALDLIDHVEIMTSRDTTAAEAWADFGTAVGVIFLVGLGVLLLIALIVALTKTSCPFVYVVGPDGKRRRIGEAYSGANLRNLARGDTIPLPTPEGTTVDVILADEADETQYTDLAELHLLDLPPGRRALATHDARLVEAADAVSPESVVDLTGTDVSAMLDGEAGWLTDMATEAAKDDPAEREGLVARFAAAPEGAALELVLKNTPLLDFLAHEYWAALGGRHGTAVERGEDPTRTERQRQMMRDAGVQVRVEVRQGGDWREVAWMPPFGFANFRHVCVPLDGVTAGEPVEVRISGGLAFLQVKTMALAPTFGFPDPVRIAPTTATGPGGVDERARLAAIDGEPQVLPERGTELALTFDLPEQDAQTERFLFLQTHGWYTIHAIEDARLRPVVALSLTHRPENLSRFGVEAWRQLDAQLEKGIRFD